MECLGMLMKAMINQNGDDSYLNRLFSYFRAQFAEEIISIVPIRKWVFLVETIKDTYVVKGYSSNRKLKLQEAFTMTLRNEGFLKTYQFITPKVNEPLYFEGTYFGCTRYIHPHRTAFSFYSEKNRQEGLDLLMKFHQVTAKFEARYRTIMPKAELIEKWQERLRLFSNGQQVLTYFVPRPFLKEMVSWADWSLNGMERNRIILEKEPYVILHGDVAHHNFLRDEKGHLYLIDFDLISIGPASYDYLQYANRILPFIDWSFEKLINHFPYKRLVQDKAFLYALAYPADIFREWNRLIRENSYTDQNKVNPVLDLTMGQFHERKKFVEQLKRRLN
jgi:hypothetical protein